MIFLRCTLFGNLNGNPFEDPEAADDGDVVRGKREGVSVHHVPELVDDVLEV